MSWNALLRVSSPTKSDRYQRRYAMSTAIGDLRNQAEHGSPGKVKTALGAAAGTCVENYDFVAYGTASALYFGDAFFPESDPTTGTLLSFATLGVGFLMRPIGGSVGGYL